MKKTYAILFLLIAMAFMLGACAATATPTEEVVAPPPAAEEPTAEPATAVPPPAEEACAWKIGFVTDVGRIDDQSFNESGYNGVKLAASSLGLSEDCYSFIETTDSADYIPNIEAFINEGFQIIVTSGFAMGTATREAGRAHPDIFFIGTDQNQVDANFAPDPIPNVTGLIFHEDVSGFLAGALAGLMTETNVIGAVYGCPSIPPVVRFEMGYTNGAKYVNPDVQVINVYHPGSLDQCFVDPEFGAETAATMLVEGVDVFFGVGGQTGNGALIAACNQGKQVIGVDFDQFITLPEVDDCILSSATKGLVDGVAALIVSVTEGSFPGGDLYGGAVLAPFHNFEDVVPQDVKDQLSSIAALLATGELNPCTAYEGAPFPDGAFCAPVSP
jgi:basic membrane protein A